MPEEMAADQPLLIVSLMPRSLAEWVEARARDFNLDSKFLFAETLEDLERTTSSGARLVLSFGTGVIVPARILDVPGMQAVNIHAASPEFPGRDPHHFAAYAGTRTYGATMHHMIRQVDAGPILMVELRHVVGEARPEVLLAMGNDCGKVLVERLFERLAAGKGIPDADPTLRWSGSTGTRRRFLELCRVNASMDRAEIERRIRACSMPGHANVHLDLHGYRFWHQPESPS